MERNYNLALDKIKNYYYNYKKFVKDNPLLASEVESALRWISYLTTATKIPNSHIISELIYSASSLLTLFNDGILRSVNDIKINSNRIVERLKIFLSVLEYTEVFSEFTAIRFYGEVGRWVIVAVIQLTKAIVRLILLIKYDQGLQRQQAIVPLDRVHDLDTSQSNSQLHNGLVDCQDVPVVSSQLHNGSVVCQDVPTVSSTQSDIESSISDHSTFTLKRSGRVLRTIDKAPPRTQRTWMSPGETFTIRQMIEKQKRNAPPSELNDLQLIGEILHIIRPVAHLTALAGFGRDAWTPYLVALGLDVTSLKMLSDPPNKHWTINERIELGQRSFSLLLYLLRSPFYDRYTKDKILRTLRFFSDHIPLFGRLIAPLINYLPEWQKTYFYVWGV